MMSQEQALPEGVWHPGGEGAGDQEPGGDVFSRLPPSP